MKKWRLKLLLAMAGVCFSAIVLSHGDGARGGHILDWHNESVSRVISPSYTFNNFFIESYGTAGDSVSVDGRHCMQAAVLNVDVRDAYGFDLNESVELTLTIDRKTSAANIAVNYDRVGGPGSIEQALQKNPSNQFEEVTVSLPSARFANRGEHGTDFMLSADAQAEAMIAVCDIRVRRSFETPAAQFGWLDLTIKDENRKPTAVRVGLYNEEGLLPIPATSAVAIRKFNDLTRTFLLETTAIWPHANRFVFYIDGRYQARVPIGRYSLVAMKGIEYRLLNKTIEVKADKTTKKTFKLSRFINMPSKGWYSGDVHIHNRRNQPSDTQQLLVQTQAEDIHVANILQMGNVAGTYFSQDNWGKEHRQSRGSHTLVTGQEDPRTLILGHSIHLNLERAVRFEDDYLNYHRVFEATAEQGGVSGYGHARADASGTVQGMTMQAAFGLLDFGEVMQESTISTDIWFALLNLGYRIAPAAGTDYPYLDHPGAVRTYIETGKQYNVDAWFSGLEQGQTFVTNGPMLSATMNGRTIGSEVSVKRGGAVSINAKALLNPDIGVLDRLDLIKHSEVVASESVQQGASALELQFDAQAQESGWYVLHAVGHRAGHDASISAMSAPFYLVVDGEERVWKREAVPAIAEKLIASLEALKNLNPKKVFESEAWDSMPVWEKGFARQFANAKQRIEQTQHKLKVLAEQAREAN
jgi:hypothetical protein